MSKQILMPVRDVVVIHHVSEIQIFVMDLMIVSQQVYSVPQLEGGEQLVYPKHL